MYMYLVHQVLVLSSHNHWRKTVKEKNLKVMQIFFFHAWEDGRPFL